MDYNAFFTEVANWIIQCNQQALKLGMQSQEFWDWVIYSSGEICNKYGNNKLAINQMVMLNEWLLDVSEGRG